MIIPASEMVRYHEDRPYNLLDSYLTKKDWYQIDMTPGERFMIMKPSGHEHQYFNETDVNAFYAFANRSKKYKIFRRVSKSHQNPKMYMVSIMRIMEGN